MTEDWQVVAGTLLGSPIALFSIKRVVRWGRRLFMSLVTKLDAIERAVCGLSIRMDKIEPDVARIKAELTPNGGSSVSDKIDKIQEQVLIVETRSRVTWSVSGEASYECDASGQNIWSSPTLCEMFGMTPDEMSGSGWTRAIVTAQEREEAWANWQHAVETGIPYEDVYRIKNQRTGEVRRVRTYTTACKTPKKLVSRYFGVVVPTSSDLEPPPKKTKPKPKE